MRPWVSLMASCAVVLACGACKDASDPDLARGEIGPDGGLLSSTDSILTIAIQPGALEETIELVIERSDEPPDVYGPAYRVQPNLPLAVPATVTYRYELPEDTSETAIGYVDVAEFTAGEGRWHALPVVRIDPAQKRVTSTDSQLSLFYALLDSGGSPLPTGTGSGTTGPTTGPTSDSATTTGPTTDSATTDPDTSVGPTTDPTTDPSDSSGSGGESDTDSTTGNPEGCDNLPSGPLVPQEFMFTGTPLDGNSEDMTFTTAGVIITRNGPDLVQINPAGMVTPIATSMALPEPTLGTRWTIGGDVVTAAQNTGELLRITSDGTVSVLWSGLGIPNGVFAALDGNIFFTDFTGALAAYIDGAGTMITPLGQGGDEAPQANGIVYDPARDYVYYVAYGPGLVYRVDVTDLANPGPPQTIATITSEGGADQVGLDGVALDTCGNLYIVDQNQGAPGSLYRLMLDAAGDPVGAPELLVETFPDGVANAVFSQGPGWEAYDTTLFTIGLPGRIFMVDVGVTGAPTPAG